MDLKLIGIENNLFGALLDLKGYLDIALVAPIAQKFEIEDGESIIAWLDPGVSFMLARRHTVGQLGVVFYVSGRMSLSEAMLAVW